MEQTLATIDMPGGYEQVQVINKEWKGVQYIDMRVFRTGPDGPGTIPTKKGIILPLPIFVSVINALEALGEGTAND
jgi:hypothetical protein